MLAILTLNCLLVLIYVFFCVCVCTQLLRSPGLPLLERLRVLLTASDILRGQGEALNVDRREAHTRLYQVGSTVLGKGFS